MIRVVIILASLFVIGCANNEKKSYFPPSSIPLTQSVAKTSSKVAAVAPYVRPDGAAALKDLSDSLFATQVEVGKYVSLVDEQSRELAKAQNDVVYWHSKQISALKELWVWRSIAIFSILAVIAYLGIRTSWRFFL